MGLGKTLTMLAAILQSGSMAEDFSDFYRSSKPERVSKLTTKATLVVVSSARKLSSGILDHVLISHRASRKLGI